MEEIRMKKTFQEKLRSKIKELCKKHPSQKRLWKASEKCLLFFYGLMMRFVGNGKRYLCMTVFVLFFLANSSFAFYGSDNQESVLAEESDITLAEESDIMLADQEHAGGQSGLLSDADALDDYTEADYHSPEAGEQYTLDDILQEHEQYLDLQEPSLKPAAGQESIPDFDENDWKLVLINKQHPIPEDYTFELETIKDGMKCDKRILEELLRMLKEANSQGIHLAIRSPYRDLSRQEFLFNRKINRYMSGGMSYMDAYKTASLWVTVPGASEHQVGLSLDITSDTYSSLDEGFGDTAEGKWLAEHSCEYGFILRYPKGKEYITSIEYEPWHFRYVGTEAATVIMNNDLTLEEFWDEYVY